MRRLKKVSRNAAGDGSKPVQMQRTKQKKNYRREQATMNKADIQRIIDGYSAKAHELRQTAKAEEAKADELKRNATTE